MSWIKSVADYLASQSLGVEGTSLFIGMMPDTNSTTVLLTEYSGSTAETQAAGIQIYKPMLQVRVRGAKEDYLTPQTRILAIQTALTSLGDTTLYGTHFLSIRPEGTIISLGQDNNLRFDFSVNLEVIYV